MNEEEEIVILENKKGEGKKIPPVSKIMIRLTC